MYLEAEQYVSDWEENDVTFVNVIKEASPLGLGEFKPRNVTYELGYWRKANAIHGWFVRNVQDGKDECQSSYVTLEHLQQLKEACEKVLANIELAPELLPGTKGFFFGNYEYDEYYESDLRKTALICDKVLTNPDSKKWWIQYRASW